jgi:hypothetical protein
MSQPPLCYLFFLFPCVLLLFPGGELMGIMYQRPAARTYGTPGRVYMAGCRTDSANGSPGAGELSCFLDSFWAFV